MNVTIRPLQEQDAYTSVKWRNDPEVFKYTGNTYEHEILLETELKWIKRVIANDKDCRCAIIADGVYVGNIYLTDIKDGSAEYHIFIGDREYWGKGVAMQASLLILDYAFGNLSLDSVHLEVKKENVSAFKLYEKLGFEIYDKHGVWLLMRVEKKQNQQPYRCRI